MSTLPVSALVAVGGRDLRMLTGASRVHASSLFHSDCPGPAPGGNPAVGMTLLTSAFVIAYFLAQ